MSRLCRVKLDALPFEEASSAGVHLRRRGIAAFPVGYELQVMVA